LPGIMNLSQSYDAAGRPKQLSWQVPLILAQGEIRLGGAKTPGARVKIEGESRLENLDFYRVWEGNTSKLYTTFDIESKIPNAEIHSDDFGTARFSTQGNGKAESLQAMTGNFRSFLT